MTKATFMKYPKLTNHYNLGRLSDNELSYLNDMEWYATEKIDGSNVSLTINMPSREWVFASRNREIGLTDEPFNNLYTLVDDDTRKEIMDVLEDLFGGYTYTIHIYGELFGGRIQQQDYDVNKRNELDVKWFDAIIEYGNTLIKVGRSELDAIVSHNVVPIVKYGKLSDLIKVEPDTVSVYGGQSECLVYKPVNQTEVTKDRYPVVKHKTKEYMERRNIKAKTTQRVPYETTELDERIIAYVVPQRLHNIISHGDIEPKPSNIGKLISAVRIDVIKEFTEESEFTEEFVTVNMNKHIMKQVADMVRDEILKGDW